MRKNTNAGVDPWLIFLLALACVLLFKNLGNIYLWEDEAETAFLARSILHCGYPKGSDGINLLKPILGMGSDYWTYHPWLSFYLLSSFFWLLGESTFSARFPFALLGLGSILLTYSLARRLYPERGIVRVVLLLLVFSVPFLLMMRQCRYYSPTLFFSLWAMIAFLKFLNKERFSSSLLTLSTLLIYFTNNGMWIPLMATQGTYLLFFFRRRETLLRFGGVLLLNLVLAVPWYVISHAFSLGAHPTWEHSQDNLEFYLRVTNKYIVPLEFWILFFALLGGYLWFQKRSVQRTAFSAGGGSASFARGELASGEGGSVQDTIGDTLRNIWKGLKNQSSILLILWILMTIAFLVFVEQRHFRYLTSLLPAFLILEAVLLWHLIQSRLRPLGISILLVVLSTNALNSPHRTHSPILNYLYEITHDYDGPNEGIILYLKRYAKPTDTVKLMYEDSPVIFYTGLKVDSRWYLEEQNYPEWIIPRRPWAEEGFWDSAYHANIKERYERIEIDYPDIQWENKGDPGYHKFRTVRDAPRVIIYRRKDQKS